jgi:hypothetical protein
MKKTLTMILLAFSLVGLAQTKVKKGPTQTYNTQSKTTATDTRKEIVVTKEPIKENDEYRFYYANCSRDTLFLYNDGLGKMIAQVWDLDSIAKKKRPVIVFYKEPNANNIGNMNIKKGLKN